MTGSPSSDGHGSGTTRVALLLALGSGLALAGCGEPERGPVPQLPPIEGDLYEARIFGFAIEKPGEWVFRPETSLKEDTEEPLTDAQEMWSHLYTGNPGVPLVSMVPEPGSDPYVGPVVEVAAIPLAKRGGMLGTNLIASGAVQILTSRIGERARNPAFEVLKEAEAVELSGEPGAVARLTYRLAGADGVERPIEELIWLVRRKKVFFYINQRAPAPMSSDLVELFERVAHSVRLAS